MGNIISGSSDSTNSKEANEQVSSSTSYKSVNALSSGNRRMVQSVQLIWLDKTIDEEKNRDCEKNIMELRRVIDSINTFTDVDECVHFLKKTSSEKVCLIVSGSLGQQTVPCVHNISQLDSIFIFCRNKAYHEEWSKNWAKIRGVFTHISSICDALKETAKQCEQDAIPISFIPTSIDVDETKKNFDKLDPSFMYTQIAKEILLTIKFKRQHFNEFITFCEEKFAKEGNELHHIEQFQREYRKKTPIWWYTYDCFLYPMLNRALRELEMDTIIKLGFFVVDLHRQIEQLYRKQFHRAYSGQSFIAYRGQGLSYATFIKMKKTVGGLLSFNNFLSTSKRRDVSLPFAYRALSNNDSVGILFLMMIDPSIPSSPFASINNFSFYEDKEDEVLFSMHTVFRITEIKPFEQNPRLFQVNLTLTSDNDKDLRVLTDYIRQETYPREKGWQRLGLLLDKMGQSSIALQLNEALLQQIHRRYTKALLWERLGNAKYAQGNYKEALKHYETTLEIRKQSLLTNHSDLAMSYNNIGLVYDKMGDYLKALSFHEKALKIRKQSLPPNHPDLTMSYNNIGLMYYNTNDYQKALSYYEKALEIRKQSLPTNHPDLATSYSNIGLVYDKMGDYPKALSFHEKALEIRKQSLPSNHPDLAYSYNNIGLVYHNMDDHPKALSYYEKALELQKQSLPSNHPDLTISYNNIGLVYSKMGDYSKALLYHEKALKIRK